MDFNPIKYGLGAGAVAALLMQINKIVNQPDQLPAPTNARSIADGQFAVMASAFGGNEALFPMLENLNPSQLESVYTSFGMRGRGSWGDTLFGIWEKDYDLFGWYNEELTGGQKERMREIWQPTNLTLTF